MVRFHMLLMFVFFCICGIQAEDESNQMTGLFLQDVEAKKIVVIKDRRIVYIASYGMKTGVSIIRKDDLVDRVHVYLSNDRGNIVLNMEECYFGVSFSVWSNGTPVEFNRVPFGVTDLMGNKDKPGYFAKLVITSISFLPKNSEDFAVWSIVDVKCLEGKKKIPCSANDTVVP